MSKVRSSRRIRHVPASKTAPKEAPGATDRKLAPGAGAAALRERQLARRDAGRGENGHAQGEASSLSLLCLTDSRCSHSCHRICVFRVRGDSPAPCPFRPPPRTRPAQFFGMFMTPGAPAPAVAMSPDGQPHLPAGRTGGLGGSGLREGAPALRTSDLRELTPRCSLRAASIAGFTPWRRPHAISGSCAPPRAKRAEARRQLFVVRAGSQNPCSGGQLRLPLPSASHIGLRDPTLTAPSELCSSSSSLSSTHTI